MPEPDQPDRTPQPFVPESPDGAKRLVRAFLARPDLGQVGVAVLVALLGFGAVVQVRGDEEDRLEMARRSDLVLILDGLSQRSNRLEEQIIELESTRSRLLSGANSEQTALEQAATRARQLGVLAGTAAASGPGIVMTISDPERQVLATTLLSAVHELRVAGAEAIQIEDEQEGVRVVADTYFFDTSEGIDVGGVLLQPPYRLTAIGDPSHLAAAMEFPLGTVETVEEKGGSVTVVERERVEVDVVLPAPGTPQYAQPAPAEAE